MAYPDFTGFSPDTLEFLRALAANNRKEWFEAHRDEYRQCLQEPLQSLASALAGPLCVIDHDLMLEPRRAVSRIHRDTRFSRDKSSYKTSMWLTFKRPVKEWQDTPAFFFEITADRYRYGMGFFSASRVTMERLREEIEEGPERFRREIAFLSGQDAFVPEGELYKREARPDLPEDLRQWHRRRNLYLVCNHPLDGRLFGRGVLDDLKAGFALLAPFYHRLWRLKVPVR